MEVVLLGLIVLTLGVLIIVLALLTRTITKLNNIEQAGLAHMESNLKKETDMALPSNMHARFETVLTKHEKYLDELLRTTTNSFDQKIHKTLDRTIQNQLRSYQSAIDEQQKQMLEEIALLSKSIGLKKHNIQTDLTTLTKDIEIQYQERLANHFTELAWQYISEVLVDSVDLHSQKDAIYGQLESIQKELKKDYKDVDKIA